MGDIFPIGRVVGIVVGHIYYFLNFVYPEQNGGRRLLQTPLFLVQFFGQQQGVGGDPARTVPVTAPVAPAGGAFRPGVRLNTGEANTRTGYTWGSGNRLGE
ncbi:hypothetical protein HK096_003527 [Nowakowskiella sp. JEL0078]|nr:hypothetical protein HK096_003527 [Nowakowskiella sp. JEL0078]